MCSFCLQEWDFRRIYCPACGEEDEKKLPVYVAEQFPHIRVEACESCKVYVRTIDLTRTGTRCPWWMIWRPSRFRSGPTSVGTRACSRISWEPNAR